MRTKIFGTLGPRCHEAALLKKMIEEGMSGVRLNLSHVSLEESSEWLAQWKEASEGRLDLLVDMQGPEMRIGSFEKELEFDEGDRVDVPMRPEVVSFLKEGQEVLLDDGKILARVLRPGEVTSFRMQRSGALSGGKSVKIPGLENTLPALTAHDRKNIQDAKRFGVTGVMQPFVRGAGDLRALRQALLEADAGDIRIFAKIENKRGIAQIEEILEEADWIVIARGDLGNDMNLWELPGAQRTIAAACRKKRVPFIVVTQMLASMEHSPVPTRAEISDIDHAILDGALGVMVTGETAVGDYPVEVMKYLSKTVAEAERYWEYASGKSKKIAF
ncbi:MAG: pyruvate kinase [Lachnospiraceae bacterium]|nr:pyruvate kinase [Lachnospiraceae bacterium]